MTDTSAALLHAARLLEDAARTLRHIADPTIPAHRDGPIADFLDSGRLDRSDPHAPMRSMDAYLSYQAWCDAEVREPMVIQRFGRAMKSAGFKIVRRSRGSYILGLQHARKVEAARKAPPPSQPALDLSKTSRLHDLLDRKAS